MELNPLLITGKIGKETPLCVLMFLDSFFDMKMNPSYIENDEYLQQFITKIQGKKTEIVHLPVHVTSAKIFKMIGDSNIESWSLESINKALESYLEFYNFEFSEKFFSNPVGIKSNKNPESMNEIMIYRLCKEINYETSLKTQFEEMCYAVQNYLNSENIKISLSKTVRLISREKALKISYKIEEHITNIQKLETNNCLVFTKFKDNIEETSKKFSDYNFILSRVIPETKNEAIILAQKRWKIYIGESNNPLYQYQILNENGIENYIPNNDVNFLTNYLINKNWYNTEKNWFINMLNSYSFECLELFCKKEGLEKKCKKSFYKSFLIQRYKTSNFYFEIVPYINNEVTYIYNEEINNVNNIICIAILETCQGYYFTVEELTIYFKTKKYLSDPQNVYLDKYSIEKIKLHCKYMISKKVNKNSFSELLKIILELEENRRLIKELPNEDIREDLIGFLKKIIDLCFIMRDKEKEENLKFQESYDYYHFLMLEYETYSSDFKDYFERINVITFCEKGNRVEIFGEILKSPDLSYSLSLLLCMKNCFTFKDSEEPSCMNTSSNWILYTSCWYLKTLNVKIEIEMESIEQLVE